jgi:hypothetical protein
MEQILQTYGAVGVELFGLAPMIVGGNARAARVAVHKIGRALHPANAALVAVVVISLNPVVKEVAHGAKVGGELDAATIVATCVRHGLPVITCSAHHFFDGVPVHLVRLGVVVAVAAHVRLVAARGNQKASAHVVLAPNHFFFLFLFFFFLFFFFFFFFFFFLFA